jgi:hypothetical protein
MALIKFTLSAGLAVRGTAIRALRNKAFMLGLDLQCDEDRGWFTSDYRCRATGDDNKVLAFAEYVNAVVAELAG